MIKWFQAKWSDPVWSKVIASGIVSICYFLYEYFKNNFSLSNTFTSITEFLRSPLLIETWLVIFSSLILIILGSLLSYKKILRFNSGGKEFVFRNQSNDDHYLSEVLYLKEDNCYNIKVDPSKKSTYWRLGFCFNNNPNISRTKRLKNLPLIHLTKNSDDNTLYVTLYDKNNQNTGNTPILVSYFNQEILISLVFDDATSSSIINIFTAEGVLLFHQKYFGCYYVQVYAWGDSNEFELTTNFQNFSRISN